MASEVISFSDFKLNKQILNAIEDKGYTTPSEIQKQAIPLILAGHDVIGIAQTGTGKTAAFLLPLLMKIKYQQGNDPRLIILAPTRELVIQIAEEVKWMCRYLDLRHTAIYGGTGTKSQKQALESGIDILIATPGRFMDLYLDGFIPTKQINTMVLDEADKMMDMGFLPQIRRILEVIPRKRQNLLFSATMPERVITLSEEFLEFPITVEVTPQATAAETIVQKIYEAPNFKTKINLLAKLLQEESLNRVIVFVKTKNSANNLFKFIERKITNKVRVIHGNKDQNTRINAFNDFKEGNIKVLVSTDVVARGVDISMVSHVINFDVPSNHEDYVHRIGRTGRANQLGTAITFVNPPDEYHITKIEGLINQKIERIELPADVKIEETPFEEEQEMARSIDYQRRKDNPAFKGAFHEKRRKNRK